MWAQNQVMIIQKQAIEGDPYSYGRVEDNLIVIVQGAL